MGNVKNFKLELNQLIWNEYFMNKLNEGIPKTSLNQYKPVLLHLEELTNKTFNNVNSDDLKSLMQLRQSKNHNHINGFFTYIISEELIKANPDVVLYLIPCNIAKMISLIFNK